MLKPFFIHLLALVLIGCVLPATTARAQEEIECDDVRLGKANNRYNFGLFDEAVDLLKPCLPGDFRLRMQRFRRKSQATQALRLLALSSYALREPPDSTRAWVRKLVRFNRRYQADPEEDPLFFQNLVDELRPPRWYQKRWVQIGGAFVVGSVVGYVLLKPGPDPLPDPGETFRPPGN